MEDNMIAKEEIIEACNKQTCVRCKLPAVNFLNTRALSEYAFTGICQRCQLGENKNENKR